MFKASKIRWLVTAVVATAATLVIAAPASAWEDLQRMNGVGHGSMPPATVQERASIQSNLVHEGRLADQRLGTAVSTRASSVASVGAAAAANGLGAQGLPVYKSDVSSDYVPGVTDSSIGVMEQVRQNARGAVVTDTAAHDAYIPGVTDSSIGVMEQARQNARDAVVTDKPAPEADPIPYLSQGTGVDKSRYETYIPGVTDSGTGVLRDLGVDVTLVPSTTREVSDDGFSWSGETAIGISATLLLALLMALGTVVLVGQRRRRMAH